ncbi:hypothetical protein BDN70DRAFT_818277, partial [Pholiota conissans]
YLQLFINDHQNDLTEWLPHTEFALNNCINASTGFSLFYINYRKHPTCLLQLSCKPISQVLCTAAFAIQMQALKDETSAALQLAAENIKRAYDKNCSKQTFAVGDCVLLNASHIIVSCPSKKLDNR